jgi:hypothetical protein
MKTFKIFSLVLWDTQNNVTMNRLELLPEELQEKIYKCAHELKFNICLYRINNHFDEHFLSVALKNMALHLYSTGISNFELNNYFECLDWLIADIKAKIATRKIYNDMKKEYTMMHAMDRLSV